MPDRPFREAQGVGDAFPAPTPLLVQGKHLLLHLRWGTAGACVGTAGPIHKTCLATFLVTPVHDPEPQDHFALLVGELVSFGERKCQQGGIPPLLLVWMNLPIGGMPHFFKNSSNAERSGLGGGSTCVGLFTQMP